jgi:hypothetical protein
VDRILEPLPESVGPKLGRIGTDARRDPENRLSFDEDRGRLIGGLEIVRLLSDCRAYDDSG